MNLKCWDDSKSLCEWREQKLLNSSKALFRKFESDVFAIVKNLSKIPVVWQGVIDSDALPDSEFVGKATVRNKSTLGSEEEMNESDDFEQNLLGSNITSKGNIIFTKTYLRFLVRLTQNISCRPALEVLGRFGPPFSDISCEK